MKQGKTIIIVGGSFAGIKAAWELRHKLAKQYRILLISDKPKTTFRASFPHVLFGDVTLDDLTMDLAENFQDTGIEFICDSLEKIDQDGNKIITKNGCYTFDYLVLATGVRHAYELLPGSKEFSQSICDPARVMATKEALANFKGGVVYAGVGAGFTPCDGPQFEVIMNLDYRLRQLGLRHKAKIHYISDKDHLLPPGGPKVWQYLTTMLKEHNIHTHLDTYLERLDDKKLYFRDGGIKDYDLCLLIPPYRGIAALRECGLGGERGFIPVQLTTMRATQSKYYNIYAVGDCVDLPGPKQGHLALMQATVAAEHIAWRINQNGTVRAYLPEFKCVIDLGGEEGLYIYSQWMSDGDIVEIQKGREPYESKIKFEKLFFAKRGDIGELHHEMMK